jgi:hypothetical protein
MIAEDRIGAWLGHERESLPLGCGGRATLLCHHADEGAFTGDLLRKLV